MKRKLLFLILIALPFSALVAQEPMRLIQAENEFKPSLEGDLFLPHAKIKYITLNPKIADMQSTREGDRVIIGLFDHNAYLSTIDRISTNINGTVTIRARTDDYPMGYLLLSVTDGSYLGYLIVPEKNEKYRIATSARSGKTYLKQVDLAGVEQPEDAPPLIPPHNPVMDDEQFQRILEAAAAGPNQEAEIDIMVVYTPKAAYWAHLYEGSIFNTIALAVELGQLALDNSNTGIGLNLVHVALVDYEETGDSAIDLYRLTTSRSFAPWGDEYMGYMDEVHDWRDTYGADLVALLAEITDNSGRAWLLNNQAGIPEFGFSLTSIRAATGLTFIHEIGHNLGAHHHKAQNTQSGPTLWHNWPENTWSAGWRWAGDDTNYYCDLMTYPGSSYWNDAIASQRVPWFSNPDITHMSQSSGDPTEGNNARTLRETRHIVAANRQRFIPTRHELTLHDQTQGATVLMGSGYYAGGTMVNISARDNYRYAFESWRDVDQTVVGEQATLRFVMPSNDVGYYAHFKPLIHNITFNVKDQDGTLIENAQITVSSDPQKSKRMSVLASPDHHNHEHLIAGLGADRTTLPHPSGSSNLEIIRPPTTARIADDGQWMHWDTGENAGQLGYGKPMNFDIASRWEPADLDPYHGEAISEIRFFPGYEDAVYTVRIWAGDQPQLIYSQVAHNVESNQWNTVKLNMPVFIDASQELWFGVNINTRGGHPAGRDHGPAVPGKGDLINVTNYGWLSIHDQYNLNYNWNLQALSGNYMLQTNNQGQTTYESVEGNHSYFVEKAGYSSATGNVSITDTDLTINLVLEKDATAIPDVSTNQISISPNPATNQIKIKADALIEKVSIVDRVGNDVFSETVNNHEAVVSVNHLGAGIYMILVHTATGVVVKKLMVQ